MSDDTIEWHETARRLFPAVEKAAYFNTAATSLGSSILRDAYAEFIADWAENGLDTTRCEKAGENARAAFAGIIGARAEDVALIPSVSAVQTATGHRSDIHGIAEIARRTGAMTFVDGSQMAGALPVAPYLDSMDFFATANHKFLLNAGRGVGYCYFRKDIQDRIVPTNAGWKAGAVPLKSFFGPEMQLSETASRFDDSLGWLSAIGDEAALSMFERFGADSIFARNMELADRLRDRLAESGRPPLASPPENRSTIVALPLGDSDPAWLVERLKGKGVICRARDGNLRLSVHFYNNFDDIERLVAALEGV